MPSRKLSVVMIARDAEEVLGGTLDCVRNLADEIVVLDLGSQDATLRIARQKATVVQSFPHYDDLAAARNAALAAASGDWILWLEPGETLAAETSQILRRFIDHEAQEGTAYYLLVRTPAAATNIAGEQVARIRLHPNVEGLQFQGRVRESLAPAIERLGFKTEGLPHVIRRGTREHEIRLQTYRAERNLRLAKLAVEDEGPTPALLNCLGEAAQALGENASAAALHRQALERSAPGSSDSLEAYYGLLTSLDGEAESRDAQIQLCMQALETFPLDAQLLVAIGGYLQSRELHELASRAYQLSAEHGQINLEIWHLEGLREIALHCLAQSLQLMDRDVEAIELLNRELAADPGCQRLRRQLLELHVRYGRREEAIAVANATPSLGANGEALRIAIRGACQAATGNTPAGKIQLETAYKLGCREPLCLRWLASCYLAQGELSDATRVVDQWCRLDPLAAELRPLRQSILDAATSKQPREVRMDSATQGAIPAPRAGAIASEEIHQRRK